MPDRSPPQFLRRDFLVGSAAGFALTGSARLLRDGQALDPGTMTPSYAQSGEDVIVAGIFDFFSVPRPSYLDIGAFLPIFSSNTYLLYQRGSQGVLVEPNVDLIPELRSTRPRDTVLNVGVGLTEQASADYYCMSVIQDNTFDKGEAERRVAASGGKVRIKRVLPIPLISINRIIAEHFPSGGPDFLSIDIESMDLAVLKTMDFTRYRPKVICAETLVEPTFRMNPETTKFLSEKGYELRGLTCANTIYADQSLFR